RSPAVANLLSVRARRNSTRRKYGVRAHLPLISGKMCSDTYLLIVITFTAVPHTIIESTANP
ncbi:MAG TPA: hypothetical protein VM011_09725, partial [Gammaproteobacteria bacterium]|nr:hypothetical protein [Gammaproteobacteria bacterium]